MITPVTGAIAGFPLTHMGAGKLPASRTAKFPHKDVFRQFVKSVTQLSFDIRGCVAQNVKQAG
jgi:hypothetical protein